MTWKKPPPARPLSATQTTYREFTTTDVMAYTRACNRTRHTTRSPPSQQPMAANFCWSLKTSTTFKSALESTICAISTANYKKVAESTATRSRDTLAAMHYLSTKWHLISHRRLYRSGGMRRCSYCVIKRGVLAIEFCLRSIIRVLRGQSSPYFSTLSMRPFNNVLSDRRNT